MKRILSFILCLTMLMSLAPVFSYADESTVCQLTEGCILPAGHTENCKVGDEILDYGGVPAGAELIAPAQVQDYASQPSGLTLSFTGCDSIDEDGSGHYTFSAAVDAVNSVSVSAESSGALSYSWERYDAANLVYVPLDPTENPTATAASLELTVDIYMLDIFDLYRCAVTAGLDGQSMTRYAYFTFKGQPAAEMKAETAAGAEAEEILTGHGTLELFQQGAFAEPPESAAPVMRLFSFRAADAKTTISSGLSLYTYSSSIDLRGFDLTPEKLNEHVQKIVNSDPMLFYLSNEYDYSYSSNTGFVLDYLPRYTMTQAEATAATEAVNAEIENIMACIDWETMDTVGTMLAVNDYFATHYQYDTSNTKHDIYSLFDGKSAVCQGYALGFLEVMKRIGIQCEVVVSTDMRHMWNIVSVYDSDSGSVNWYHIDVTWNDPITDRLGRAGHYYFLVSDSAMTASRDHRNWSSNQAATDGTYDDYFWGSVNTPFACVNGVWYFVDQKASSGDGGGYANINSCNLADGSTALVKPCHFTWRYADGGYSGCGKYGSGVMVNSGSAFYKYDPASGALSKIADADADNKDVMASFVSGSEIVYGISGSTGGALTARRVTPVPVSEISISSDADSLASGSSMQMSAALTPANASIQGVVWSVTDGTGTATIDENGLLLGGNMGTVTVRATARDGSGVYATKNITIAKLTAEITVSSSEDALTIEAGTDMPTMQMSAAVQPADVTDNTVVWSVIDGTGTATISADGLLTAATPGTVTVRATAGDGSGAYGEKELTLYARFPASVTVDTPTAPVKAGDEVQMSATVLPSETLEKSLSWSIVSGEDYATISEDGLLTALAPGLVTIKAVSTGSSSVFGELSLSVDCDFSYAVNEANEITITGYSGDGGDIIVPASIGGKPVTAFGAGTAVFTPDTVIASLILPTALTSIGDNAFNGCTQLGSVIRFTAAIKSIGAGAFMNSSLRSFYFFGDAPSLSEAGNADASFPEGAKLLYVPGKAGWSEAGLSGYDTEALSISVTAPEALAVGGTAQPELATNINVTSVTWSIVSGGDYATIDSATGLLTGVAVGEVTVRATDETGFGIYGEATIGVVSYGLTITGGDIVSSRQSLTLTAEFYPSNLTDTTILWTLADGDNAYATLSSNRATATVRALAFTGDEERSVTVTASAADGKATAATQVITLKPSSQSVAIYKGAESEAATGQTITLDISGENKTLQLRADTLPAVAANAVTWSSSGSSVASVDRETGLVTGVRPGTVTIRATAADGSGRFAWVKVQVIYMDAASRLTAASANEPIPSFGLQSGFRTTMQVFGTDKTTPMDPSLFTYSISSSQSETATVDENGVITAGLKPGTARVTAALTGDPLNRRATLNVRVIARQVESVLLTPVISDASVPYTLVKLTADGQEILDDAPAARYLLRLNKADLGTGTGSYSFTIASTGRYSDGTEIQQPTLSYTSSDTRLATVTTAGDGGVTVSVRLSATATGECTITGTARDQARAANFITIQIRDYSPRIEASTLTLNPKLSTGVTTPLLASYGNTVQSVSLYEYNTDTRAYDIPSTRLAASYADDILTIRSTGEQANATVRSQLMAQCQDGKTYPLPLTVSVRNTLPSISVRQSGRFNLFYTDSSVTLTVAAGGNAITDIKYETVDGTTFKGVCSVADSTVNISYADAAVRQLNARGLPYAQVKLTVTVAGYASPIEKLVTISTATTKPSLSLSASSSVLNTAMGDKQSVFSVYDRTNRCTLDLDVPASCEDEGVTVATDLAANTVTLTWGRTSSGTAAIKLQNSNWTQPITLTHRVSVTDALPTARLSTGTLRLNNAFTGIADSTELTLSQAGLRVKSVAISSSSTSQTLLAEADKLALSFKDGVISSQIKPGQTPNAGVYGFTLTPWLEGESDASSDDIALRSVRLYVSVSSAVPRVSLVSSSLRLNGSYLGQVASSAIRLSLSGYTVTGVTSALADDNSLTEDSIRISFADGVVTATLMEVVPNGSYNYLLTPSVKHDAAEQVLQLSPVTLRVTVYSSTGVSVSVLASGRLDALDREGSGITYTVTRLNNITGTLRDPVLLGVDADKFTLSGLELDPQTQRQSVELKLKSDLDYMSNVNYKVQLGFAVVGVDGLRVETPALNVRVTQSSLRLNLSPTVKPVYQSATGYMSFRLDLGSPLVAKIGVISVNAATSLELRQAMGSSPVRSIDIDPDSRGATVCLHVRDAARLRAGRSYSLTLDVTPQGATTNLRPTQVRATIRAYS